MGETIGVQMEHLLRQLQRLEGLQKGAILLLDYDGTLVPIAKRPELAILLPDMKALLKSLVRRFLVAIISGRSLREVKKLVGVKGIYYVGNHGLEIDGPRTKLLRSEAKRIRPFIAGICTRLRENLGAISGAIIEDKGLTASIHYRLVAWRELPSLKNIFGKIVEPYVDSGKIRVTYGKKVFEIRPKIEWDKGKAVLWVIDVVDPKGKLTPVYIGDDQTDEDAFLALKNKGVTVLVAERRRKSHAMFFLKNVGEVKIFLKELAKA
jgi:trehalose-phosphatase